MQNKLQENEKEEKIMDSLESELSSLNLSYKDEYIFRTLEIDDYNKGYFSLLSQLTVAPLPEYDDYTKRFNELKNTNLSKIFIVEHKEEQKIIATITCLLEFKFIRNLGSICHIEDFVIDEKHRNKKIGSKMINLAKEYARVIGAYKIILDAREDAMGFYEKIGFKKSSNGMTIYLEKN